MTFVNCKGLSKDVRDRHADVVTKMGPSNGKNVPIQNIVNFGHVDTYTSWHLRKWDNYVCDTSISDVSIFSRRGFHIFS